MPCATSTHRDCYCVRSFSQRQHVREQSICSWNTGRQLSKPGITCVHKETFAGLRHQQTTVERLFLWIVARQDRCPCCIPLVREIKAAFLHPSLEIFRCNLVWSRHQWMIRRQNTHVCIFVSDAVA